MTTPDMASQVCFLRLERRRGGSDRKVPQTTSGVRLLRFMNEVAAAVPDEPGQEIPIVLDNASTHKTEQVKQWFARRPRYHGHFTPTGSSWLNQVERFFAEITNKRIRRGAFRSINQLDVFLNRLLVLCHV